MTKVTFKITGTREGEHIEDTCMMELIKSEAFQYGNGTCVAVEYGSGYNFVIDTRYEKGVTGDNFENWAYEELRARTDPVFEVSVIK